MIQALKSNLFFKNIIPQKMERKMNFGNTVIWKIRAGVLYELVDPHREIEKNQQMRVMVSAVAELAFICLASERSDRLHMKGIVAQPVEIRRFCGACPARGERCRWFPNRKQLTTPLSPTLTLFI